jgi:transposase
MKEKEPKNAEAVIKDNSRRTKRKFSSVVKIKIVISGLGGDESINTICRKEGIAPALYYRWSKDFIEAGKRRLNGNTLREANTDELQCFLKAVEVVCSWELRDTFKSTDTEV